MKIRGIIDSNNEVRESDETLNHTSWLEVQLPSLLRSGDHLLRYQKQRGQINFTRRNER